MFSFTQVTAQGSDLKSDLKASVDGNNVNLEWKAPNSESAVSFNIYRAPINNSKMTEMSNSKKSGNGNSETVDPSDLSFKKIGSTKDLEFTDKLDAVVPGSSGKFYYYITTVTKDGEETRKSNFAKITVSNSNSNLK